MILILAFTYREAQRIAREDDLSPLDWRFCTPEQLRGRREPEVWVAECWYDQGKKIPAPTEDNPEATKWVYPMTEDLAITGAKIKRVPCA